MPPPASGGGAAKYILILLILLAGGIGGFIAFSGSPEPATPPTPVEPPRAERSTALVDDTLEIPEPEEIVPDAGAPKPEEPKKPSRAKGDAWACQGDIAAKDIKRVLADAQSQVRSCYERRLRNNNLLQGTVNLQVKVDAGGRVVSTRVRGTLNDAEVSRCVQALAKSWTFPAPAGGNCAVFDAPYNFTPKN
jgi:TonB family protein